MSKRENWKSLAVQGAYKTGLFEIGRLARKDSILILCYHRFTTEDRPTNGATPLRVFEKHLRYLQKRFTPISFEEMNAMKRGMLSVSHPVLLTVDDGYHDFFDFALPALRKYRFPATLFVTTRFLDGEIWLWPDVINYALNKSNQKQILLPDFHLSLPLRNVQEKAKACTQLHCFYKKLPASAHEPFLSETAEALKVNIPDTPTSDYRPAAWSQLKEARKDLVRVGSHTLSHRILSQLLPEEAQREIAQSKKRIESELDEEISVISYPNGMRGDYRDCDKEAVRRSGYLFASTCNFGFNWVGSDPLELNRIVASSEIAMFIKEISGFETLIHKDSHVANHVAPRNKRSSKMAVTICDDNARDKWNSFVLSHPDATIFHHFDWKHVFGRAYKNRCFYLLAEENKSPAGVLPLVFKNSRMFGKFLVSLPYFDHAGLCAYREDAQEALILRAAELAREMNASYIELRHDRQLNPDLPSRQEKVAMVLELPSTSDLLWEDLRAKVRNQIRKGVKEHLAEVNGKAELLDEFFTVYARNMRDLGSPSHRMRFFQQILEFYPESVRIFCIRHNENPVAAGLTIASQKTLCIPWASSLREFNSKCPNMFLYWTVLKYACERGFSYFSFGRSTPGEGTYQFKRQWGAQPLQLYWEYWLAGRSPLPRLTNGNPKYSLPIKVWKSLPVAVTRKLGPRLIQNLA